MYRFKDDYSEGAHPRILEKLIETNFEQLEGYGLDKYSVEAADKIRELIEKPDADIHFVSGGTQANLLFISHALRPYESVIAVDTGHINVHETGSIEAVGHKINVVPNIDGKITVENIAKVLEFNADEHMVLPRMVYISNSTELGTIYSKKELEAISEFCKKNNLYLFVDGARIGVALTSEYNDMSFADLASMVDAMYIGGTKNGALLGEAIVIMNDELKSYFRHSIKQKGALLAKGRVAGIQFLELFKDDLYFSLARHSNNTAKLLALGIEKLGYKFKTNIRTNQIFPILPDRIIEKLISKFEFYVWERYDETSSVVRLVTSWATPKSAVDEFIEYLELIS